MNKAYKFRIYPNKEQQEFINKTIGSARFIYNRMLADKIKYYKEFKKTLNNSPAQYKKEFEWLKEVDSLALANSQLNLNIAYKNFFRDKSIGFPKFKSKKKATKSYTTNNQRGSIRLSDNNRKITLPKLKDVKIKCHRTIKKSEIIKSATITLTPSNKYYISIMVKYEQDIVKIKPNIDKSIGLDFSMKEMVVDNNGKKINYPYYYYKYQDKLAKEQMRLARKIKGSSNYEKQRIKVAKVHELIANSRKDFQHKLSKWYVDNYDVICVEDIDLKAMSQYLNFGKKTMDNSFGMFREFLKYKIETKGGHFVKIGKWFPSSKLCRHCGTVNSELKIGEFTWTCSCGEVIERDINAGINIKTEGFRILTEGNSGIA